MNSKFPLLAIIVVMPCFGWAQPVLLPSIGIGNLPTDSDPICVLPTQTPPIQSVGRPAGEQAADFTLYDVSGNAFNLEDALLQGKPVLMISASYTCPVFRGKIPLINDLVATYGEQLSTVIVYTVEAHPEIDISPYFGSVNTGAQNISAGILYQQPDTYGERKAVLQDMLDSLEVDAPILVDGPCNEWWSYYGPQPNNAYLIDTSGTIFRHHDWLDKPPDDIYCDIDSLLGLPTDCEQTFGGQFTLQMVSNDTISGDAGSTITGHATLANPTSESCLVRIVKLQVDMPLGWSSSLCADVCYLPDVDTAIVEVVANSSLEFYYYFYTTGAGTGYTRVGFRNENDNGNAFMRDLWGIASEANAIGTTHVPMSEFSLGLDHVGERLLLFSDTPPEFVRVVDANGRKVIAVPWSSHISIAGLAPGLYVVSPAYANGRVLPGQRFLKD